LNDEAPAIKWIDGEVLNKKPEGQTLWFNDITGITPGQVSFDSDRH
jgi:hypothetical protein